LQAGVIRTSVDEAAMTAEQAVLNYKRLAEVERAFRTLKGVDLKVRPICHRLEPRVKAHIFLSMLAHYVQWHMMQAWQPLTFADEVGADAARLADPVAPARRSPAALAKAHTRTLADGTPAMSFARLLAHLATVVRNTPRAQERASRRGHLHPHHPSQRQTAAGPRSDRRHHRVASGDYPAPIPTDRRECQIFIGPRGTSV
jgi:hypothetical protein